jgi:hypothetical protein
VGGYVFTATPDHSAPVDNEASRAPPFDAATWFVPSRGSPSKAVGFLPEGAAARADVITSGFQVLDRSVTLEEKHEPYNKFIQTLFCAIPTATPGIWELSWNETNRQAGGYPVTLRDFYTAGAPTFNPDARCSYDV